MNLELDINSCLTWQRTQCVHSNNRCFTADSYGNQMVVTCFTAGSYCIAYINLGTNLGIGGKKLLSLPISQASGIEWAADGENPFSTGSSDDMTAKGKIAFTARSYVGPAVKPVITAGYSARRGSHRYEPAVIRITAGYLKTIGKGPSDE